MSHISQNLGLTVLEEGEQADLTTVSDNFDAIDAVVGDIATVESSPTASSHAVGEFLLYEGRLYKVTSAISAGASLVLGTNVAVANIGSEIKSLQDLLDMIQVGKSAAGTIYLRGYLNSNNMIQITCASNGSLEVLAKNNGNTYSKTL